MIHDLGPAKKLFFTILYRIEQVSPPQTQNYRKIQAALDIVILGLGGGNLFYTVKDSEK